MQMKKAQIPITFPLPVIPSNSHISRLNRNNFESYCPTFTSPVLNSDLKLTSTKFKTLRCKLPSRENSPSPTNNTFDSPRHFLPIGLTKNPPKPSRFAPPAESDKSAIDQLTQASTKLFISTQLTEEDLGQTHSHYNLLRIFFKRKFGSPALDIANKDNFSASFKRKQLAKINSRLALGDSQKRVEENNKFVFKLAIRKLRKQFLDKSGLPNRRSGELKFYRHYFGELADSIKLPLNSFFDPLYRTNLKNRMFKSINNGYMGLVFKSRSFRKEFVEFLHFGLIKEYEEGVGGKVEDLLGGLRSELEGGEEGEGVEEKVFERHVGVFGKKARFKLPWTLAEAHKAADQFKMTLANY